MHRYSLLLLALAASLPAAHAAAHAPVPAEAATPAPPEIVGDYTVTLSESAFPPAAPQDLKSTLAGTWSLAFHPGNHFVATHDGEQVVEGPYQLQEDRLLFGTGESGPYACNVPATYTWRISERQLTLAPVGQDPCEGRALVLASRPFTRTP